MLVSSKVLAKNSKPVFQLLNKICKLSVLQGTKFLIRERKTIYFTYCYTFSILFAAIKKSVSLKCQVQYLPPSALPPGQETPWDIADGGHSRTLRKGRSAFQVHSVDPDCPLSNIILKKKETKYKLRDKSANHSGMKTERFKNVLYQACF